MQQFEIASGIRMEMLGFCRSTRSEEEQIHRSLRRFCLFAEWYPPNVPEVEAVIAKIIDASRQESAQT